MLRVIPHRGDSVAVVVAHRAGGPEDFIVAAQFLHKFIHQAAVRSSLLVAIVVVFVARHRHARGNSEWIRFVRIVSEQPRRQESVGSRGILPAVEGSLARKVKGVRVSAEIMVERNVLLKDHHNVLDGCLCRGTVFPVFLRVEFYAGFVSGRLTICQN